MRAGGISDNGSLSQQLIISFKSTLTNDMCHRHGEYKIGGLSDALPVWKLLRQPWVSGVDLHLVRYPLDPLPHWLADKVRISVLLNCEIHRVAGHLDDLIVDFYARFRDKVVAPRYTECKFYQLKSPVLVRHGHLDETREECLKAGNREELTKLITTKVRDLADDFKADYIYLVIDSHNRRYPIFLNISWYQRSYHWRLQILTLPFKD